MQCKKRCCIEEDTQSCLQPGYHMQCLDATSLNIVIKLNLQKHAMQENDVCIQAAVQRLLQPNHYP